MDRQKILIWWILSMPSNKAIDFSVRMDICLTVNLRKKNFNLDKKHICMDYCFEKKTMLLIAHHIDDNIFP